MQALSSWEVTRGCVSFGRVARDPRVLVEMVMLFTLRQFASLVRRCVGETRRGRRRQQGGRALWLERGIERLESRAMLADLGGAVRQMIDVAGLTPDDPAFFGPLAGVTVELDNGSQAVTDASGAYSFSNVATGLRTVSVVLPTGFLGTTAQSLSYTVNVGSNDVPGLNFALAERNQAIVQNLFELVIQRPAAAEEFTAAVDRLNAGGSVSAEFGRLIRSTEFSTAIKPVSGFVQAMLPGVLEIGMVRASGHQQRLGIQQDATIQGIMATQAFVDIHGNTSLLTNADYVRFLYRELHNRSPSSRQLKQAVTRLDSGTSRGQVALDVVGLPAFQARRELQRSAQAAITYAAVLGREATQAEINSFKRSSIGSVALAGRLARSQEFLDLDGYTSTAIWDVMSTSLTPPVAPLDRLQLYNPDTQKFDLPVTAGSITSSLSAPRNLYVYSHGWSPGYSEQVMLSSTPSNPLRSWAAVPNGLPARGLGLERLESRLIQAAIATDLHPAEAVRDALLAGVERIADMGTEGTVAVFGADAVSVLQDSEQKTIVAAGFLGSGRVVAAAKTGFVEFSNDTIHDTRRFYENVLEWVSQGKGFDARIVTDIASAESWLTSHGYTSVSLRDDWQASLSDADLLVTNLVAASGEQQQSLGAFLAGGGGIFAGYNGWAFSYASLTPITSGGNAVLREAGLSWTDDVSWAFDGMLIRGLAVNNASSAAETMNRPGDPSAFERQASLHAVRATFASVPASDERLVSISQHILDQASALVPSPSTPVGDPIDRWRLQVEATVLAHLPVDVLFAHRTAEGFGTIAHDAPRISKDVVVRASKANAAAQWLSTGVYAAPGEVVTVTIPSGLVGQGWTLKVGSHTDDVSGSESYARMPFGVSRDFTITGTSARIGSVYGGMVYVVKPQTTASASYRLTFSNAVAAPTFVLGRTSDLQWRRKIRDLPAPYAELVCSRLIITLRSEDIRQLGNPSKVMRYWNSQLAAQDALVGNSRRTRPERINDDLQISAGWMHSGYPVMAFDRNLANMVDSDPGDDWGFFHEFGHNLQSEAWTFATEVEVTVNILTMRAFDSAGTKPRDDWAAMWTSTGRAGLIDAFVGGGRDRGLDARLSLGAYAQLRKGFGWRAFADFFEQYRSADESELPANDQAVRDQWVIQFSRVTGRNLGPFFQAWGFQASQSALDAVADLPMWSLIEAVSPNPVLVMPRDTSIVIDPRSGFSDILVQGMSIAFSPSRFSRWLVANSDGSHTFTPPAGFSGRVRLPFVVRNQFGGEASGKVTVLVTRDLPV